MPDSLSTRSLSIRHPQASYSASSPPGSQTSSFRPAGLLVPTAKVTEQPKLTISTSSVLPVLLSARLLSSTGAIASTVRSSCLHFGLPLLVDGAEPTSASTSPSSTLAPLASRPPSAYQQPAPAPPPPSTAQMPRMSRERSSTLGKSSGSGEGSSKKGGFLNAFSGPSLFS
jgi:hypothetical protein